jgi:cell division protein FtsZ
MSLEMNVRPEDYNLLEVGPIMLQVVTSLADPEANVIFGAVIDSKYEGELHVTIIATGFSQAFEKSLFSPKAAAATPVTNAAKKELQMPSWKNLVPSSSKTKGLW